MIEIFQALENRSQLFWIITGSVFVGLLGIADYLTGYELNFSLFYLAPVALVSWYSGQWLGLFISILSAFAWLAADIASRQTYSQPALFAWNALIQCGVFIITSYLIVQLRRLQKAERAAARTDYITGAMNARHFHEVLEMELRSSRRYPHPFTVAYMDIDNFKLVNDKNGHETGNEVIRFVVGEMKRQLRNTDIIARIGGDEFALLLPFCRQPESEIVITRLHTHLTTEMRRKNWPLTFSMGVVICEAIPDSAAELIKMSDELMYAVKHSTKNDIRFLTYKGKTANHPDRVRPETER